MAAPTIETKVARDAERALVWLEGVLDDLADMAEDWGAVPEWELAALHTDLDYAMGSQWREMWQRAKDQELTAAQRQRLEQARQRIFDLQDALRRCGREDVLEKARAALPA